MSAGLLCFNCNGALGQFRDRTDLMVKAVAYLEPALFGPAIAAGATRAPTSTSVHRWTHERRNPPVDRVGSVGSTRAAQDTEDADNMVTRDSLGGSAALASTQRHGLVLLLSSSGAAPDLLPRPAHHDSIPHGTTIIAGFATVAWSWPVTGGRQAGTSTLPGHREGLRPPRLLVPPVRRSTAGWRSRSWWLYQVDEHR